VQPVGPDDKVEPARVLLAKVTSTPSASWCSAVMESSNTNSACSRAASYKIAASSARGTSTSVPSGLPAGTWPILRPEAVTKARPDTLVATSRRRGRTPICAATSIASPRTSTGLPLERCPAERSTTVGWNP
jgi:hypothetical protein